MNINGLKGPDRLFSIENNLFFCFISIVSFKKHSKHPSVPLMLKRPLCNNQYNLVLCEENIMKLEMLSL